MANASKLKTADTLKERRNSFITFPILQPLPTDISNTIDTLDEKSEIELKIIDYMSTKEKSPSNQKLQNNLPLTMEILLGFFYKCHNYKPATTVEVFKDESSEIKINTDNLSENTK